MITFCLKSFGKVKLIVSRLSKLTNHVECILNSDCIRFIYNNISITVELKILEGVLSEEGEGFRLNVGNLHNILKNLLDLHLLLLFLNPDLLLLGMGYNV